MGPFVDRLRQDLRHAARMLLRSPSFTATVVLTLALGIGGVSAILSLVDAVLLRPLPFREPDRIVLLWEQREGRDHNVAGPWNLLRWRDRARSFSAIAGFAKFELNALAGGEPERVQTGLVTGNLFDVLGVAPLLGRPLTEQDSKPNAPAVVVLAEGYWRRRFAADPAVVGRSMELSGDKVTIVGVAPASLQVPPDVAVWSPLTIDEQMRNARGRWIVGVARLADGVTLLQARDEMTRISADLARENPSFDTGWSVNVQPIHADLVRQLRPAVLVLLVAVVLVLLIACANVANLLLARALAREREIALRSTLGASRGRVLAQLLTESLFLAALGGGLGVLLGRASLSAMVALLPPEIPVVVSVGMSGRVLCLTTLVALLSALVFGLGPALALVQPTLAGALRQTGAVRGAGGARLRLKNALVVGEVALSVALLVGALLLLRSFVALGHVDPGFRADGVVTAEINLSASDRPQAASFFARATDAVRALPGVEAVGAMSWMPMTTGSATSFRALDRPEPPPGEALGADVRFVTPGLFAALQVPVKEGRAIAEEDREGAPIAVVINESGARLLWPGRSAVGQRIGMEWGKGLEATVVGVVGDVRLTSLQTPARTTLYWAQAQVPNSFMTLMVRGGDASTLGPAIRKAVASVDPTVPLRLRTLPEVLDSSVASQRFLLLITQAFALLAALLAAIGIHGVLSYAVSRRTPEMGVRQALGATPGALVRLVVGGALRLGTAGVALGLAGAAAGASLLQSQLFGVSPWDPLAYGGVAAALVILTTAAAVVPARRAAAVQPAVALRNE